jgi:hypothetical protein
MTEKISKEVHYKSPTHYKQFSDMFQNEKVKNYIT